MRLSRRKPVALCVLSLSFVLLLFAEPSQATISRVHSTAGQITAGSGSITVPSTAAGNLLVVQVALFNGTPQVSSVTDGGDTFVLATNSRPSDGQVETWYCLNTAGGKTSVTVTANSSVTMDVDVNEYQAPGATWSFDIANSQTRQSATTTPTSPTLTTTGSNDVVVSLITSPAGVTGCVSNLGQTFNLVNTFDGEGYLDLLNVPAGTYQAKCNLSASQIYESDIAAFAAGSGGGGGSITYIQSNEGLRATVGNATATFSAQPTAGNTVVVGLVCWASAGCQITSVADNFSNTYTQIGTTAHYVGTQADVALYCASGISSGSNFQVTATLTNTGGDSDLYIAEYSGLTCNVDQSAIGSGSTSTTSLQTSSVTTTNATDLLVAVAGSSTGNAATAGSGYTLRQNDNGGTAEYGGFEDQTVAATGSYSGSMTLAVTTSNWGMAMAALKGSSTGGGAPTITAVSPASGQAGDIVAITGQNFGTSHSNGTVTFGGVQATPVASSSVCQNGVSNPWSNTCVAVVVPGGQTTAANVVVTVSGVPSNPFVFTYNLPITRLSPPSGPTGISVSIIGSNFGSTPGTVTFHGAAPTTATAWNPTLIIVTVPSAATTGAVTVTVGGQTSNGVTFTVTSASGEPNITSLNPTSAAVGAQVTITGNGFGATQGSGLVWLGTQPGNVVSWSATQIVATVASGAKTGNARVLQNDALSNSVPFTVSGSCP
jgi:IPT/TIG domain